MAQRRRKLKLVLAYDGTDFHGWQRQAGMRTVQGEIEAVMARYLGFAVEVVGASRTDAGVHARGQVAHVEIDSPIPNDNLRRILAEHLPSDIGLWRLEEVPPTFDAIRDARWKRYRYRIFNARLRPVTRMLHRRAWHVWFPLDVGRMQSASSALVGTHDFAGYASQGSPRTTTVRTIRRVYVRRRGELVVVDVEGDGFLYNQVRNMVGTLHEIGRGHWDPDRAALVLATRDRQDAGPPAPACGLSLEWIRYDPEAGVP